jgi:hypothetical protein
LRESDESDGSQEHGIAGAVDLNANVKLHEVTLIPIDRVGEAAVIHVWRAVTYVWSEVQRDGISATD